MKNERVLKISYVHRPMLLTIFHEMLDRKSRDRVNNEYDALRDRFGHIFGYDNWDFDGDDDAFGGSAALTKDEYFAVMGNYVGWEEYKKRHKKKSGGKKKKGKLSSFVKKPKNLVEDDSTLDELLDSHTIYFYADYQNKYSREVFNTLKDFDNFCKDQGFKVPKLVSEDLCYNKVSHVCIAPMSFLNGKFEIMCSNSYGDLFYNALCMEESYADM